MTEHSTQTESRILEAATEIFLQKGKDGTRMQEIAERAGINKALLHYYFRSKDRLYEEVFRNEFEKFLGEFFDSIPDTDDFRQVLRFFIGNYIDRLAARPELIHFVFWEIRQGGDTLSKILRRRIFAGTGQEPLLIGVIERGVQKGTIRRIDPLHFIISLVGVCVYPFIARPMIEKVVPDLDVLSRQFLEQRKVEIYNLFWEGIKPQP